MNFALIPARKGSKRLSGKNIAMLGGKPLIEYTIEAVLGAGFFDKIVVSSDDYSIEEIVSKYSDVEFHLRDESLADNKTTTSEVLHYLLCNIYGLDNGLCGLFLPTSPFRGQKDILEAINLFNMNEYDTLVSVSPYSLPIDFALNFTDDKDTLLNIPQDSPLRYGKTRSQEYKKAYHPNGAIYFAKTKLFLETKSFFTDKTAGYILEAEKSLDIDEKLDLEFAEFLLNAGKIKID